MPVVSIVISVYNTSIYLEECLKSVINQTLKDIEIICVDDCSSDCSVDILNNYENKDSRIFVIKHDRNRGLLETRGDGVRAATGKYIIFLDSDDFIDLDTCERLSLQMDATGCDIIQFGTNVIPHGNVDSLLISHYIQFLRPCKRTIIGQKIFDYQFGGTSNWHIWNKIYRSELCKKAYEMAQRRYMIVSDDLYISFYIAFFAKKMKGTTKKYYNYNIGRGYTNSSNSILNQIKIISSNSWFIIDCIDFLNNKMIFDKYRKYCFREPLLQLGACVSLMNTIKDEEIKEEALCVIRDSWSFDPFKELLQEMIEDEKWSSLTSRIKRHISDFGLIKTVIMIGHVISFAVRRKITQLFN